MNARRAAKIFTFTSGRTFGAEKVLLKQIKGAWVECTDRQKCDIVMLFCVISSRVGSDVHAAMSMLSVSAGEKVILVLMHHTRDVDYSTAGTKWSNTYKNIVLDVHVLYHESVRGLLVCPKNKEAVRQIQHELRAYSNCYSSNSWFVTWKRRLCKCKLMVAAAALVLFVWFIRRSKDRPDSFLLLESNSTNVDI